MAKSKKKSKPKAEKPAKTHAANRKKRRTKITKITREVRETRSNPRPNPPIGSDITHVLLPGFAAFAATKVLQRIVYAVVQKRWPKLGKHAHALAGVAGFAGVWFFAHRIKQLAKYHDGVVMGSGVAALHGVASCYLPKKYNWLLAECRPEDVVPLAPGPGAAASQLAPAVAGDEYSYLEDQLDEMESGGSRSAKFARGSKPTTRPVAAAMAHAQRNDGSDVDPDLLDALEPGEEVDDLYSGAFAN